MIYIKEDKCKKIPGITSLYINFDYNADIINIVKSFQPVYMDKKTYTWEVSSIYITEVLDKLSVFDDIDLTLYEEPHEKEYKEFELSKYKIEPFEYQKDAIQYGLNHDKFLLLDPPGLGKTAVAIHLVEERLKRKEISKCLVICGVNTLKYNWAAEIQKHSNLTSTILGSRINKSGKEVIDGIQGRLNHLKSNIKEDIVITNIETLRNSEVCKEILNGSNKFDMIILDEAHVCKNPSSQQGKNLLKLNKAKYQIAMTGTLLLNSPMDAYVSLKWIGKELACFSTFRYMYTAYGGPFHNIPMGWQHIDVLKEQLSKCSIRRDKSILKLPPKTVIEEFVDMNDKQHQFYDNIIDGILEQVDKVKMTQSNALALTTRLRQATALPSILTTDKIESSKIIRAVDLAEQFISNGEKVVIFSMFKPTVYELERLLKEYNPLIATGDTDDIEFEINKNLFQTDAIHKVFICTCAKCGVGVTLNAATVGIFIDTPFTAGDFEQCSDRIYRIGSDKPVYIYNLIAKGTFDERVAEIVSGKRVVSDYIIDDKVSVNTLEILKNYIADIK